MEKISELRKTLYLEARALVSPMHHNDSEIVKLKRDNIISELYDKKHDKLTATQLTKVIDYIRNGCEKESIKKFASARQLTLLRFFSMKCALRYANWDLVIFEIDGVELSGKALQERVEFLYLGRQFLPKPVISFMFSTWINAKCNEYLTLDGFKKFAKNSNRIVYEYLSSDQAKMLINRFQRMAEEIFKRESPKLIAN